MTKREMALRLLEQATAKRPVTRWQLMAMLEMNDRDAREVIHTLRLQGYRICSGRSGGYWLAKNEEELESFLRWYEHYPMEALRCAKAMRAGRTEGKGPDHE